MMYEVHLGMSLKDQLEIIERDVIHRALLASGYSRRYAAKMIGMRRTNLLYKLKKYELEHLGKAKEEIHSVLHEHDL